MGLLELDVDPRLEGLLNCLDGGWRCRGRTFLVVGPRVELEQGFFGWFLSLLVAEVGAGLRRGDEGARAKCWFLGCAGDFLDKDEVILQGQLVIGWCFLADHHPNHAFRFSSCSCDWLGCPFPRGKELLHGGLGSSPWKWVQVVGFPSLFSHEDIVGKERLVEGLCICRVGAGSVSMASPGNSNNGWM